MKTVMLSIRPKWCELIANGKKTAEVRKTRPKLEEPFKCYIYCTKATQYFYHGGIGETLDDLYRMPNTAFYDAGKIKFGYSGELMCCHADYDSSNFLNGKVIGEFTCQKIEYFDKSRPFSIDILIKFAHLTLKELFSYVGDSCFYAWYISDLVIFEKPKDLAEFGLKKAPQGWCYCGAKIDEEETE